VKFVCFMVFFDKYLSMVFDKIEKECLECDHVIVLDSGYKEDRFTLPSLLLDVLVQER